MKTVLFVICTLLFGTTLQLGAQRRIVVADMETWIPIAGVNVTSRDGTTTTDSLGYISISSNCRTLTFSHVNYESKIINVEEVRDTVFLMSKLLNIGEVIVLGHGNREGISESLKKQLRMEKTEAELAAADPSNVNLLPLLSKIIPKKWRKGYRKEMQRKRLQKILEEY